MNESSDAAPVSCIGIILDGNRRWAKEHHLPQLEGHRVGLLKTLRATVRSVQSRGIRHLAVFLFSTENWNREPAEVSYLMDLFLEQINKEVAELGKEGVRIRFAGQRERFSEAIQAAMHDAEKHTEQNEGLTLWCCMSYGGRAEIVAAARAAAAAGDEITEASLAGHLWTAGMPDPDIIIRTSGEQRLSGFLTWESVYSELFFIDAKWPDFSEAMLDAILAEYAQRERRRGK
ncbi:di-trans,poly-cis-decaprenylcistransferase [Patescibacteria group bacterium]|nr:di-trans,poly-cis-decaprenylcistransferase [Patescibacteria group bacterium]